jgi:hypothetical protein
MFAADDDAGSEVCIGIAWVRDGYEWHAVIGMAKIKLHVGRTDPEVFLQAAVVGGDAQLVMYPDASHGAQSQHAGVFLEHAPMFLNG